MDLVQGQGTTGTGGYEQSDWFNFKKIAGMSSIGSVARVFWISFSCTSVDRANRGDENRLGLAS